MIGGAQVQITGGMHPKDFGAWKKAIHNESDKPWAVMALEATRWAK